jgi:hypothetical protein
MACIDDEFPWPVSLHIELTYRLLDANNHSCSRANLSQWILQSTFSQHVNQLYAKFLRVPILSCCMLIRAVWLPRGTFVQWLLM